MDITQSVDSIVNNLVRDIEARLNDRVSTLITRVLEERLANIDLDSRINLLASAKLDHLMSGLEIDQKSVSDRIERVADAVIVSIEGDSRQMARELVRNKLYQETDLNKMVRDVVAEELMKRLGKFDFPPRSIPGLAVNPQGLELTGNNIVGGVIRNFNSSGIEDKSTEVQMTLLDQAVVIENNVITTGLTVKGSTLFEGDVRIEGNMPADSLFFKTLLKQSVDNMKKSLSTELFQEYSHVVFALINEKGLSLDKLSIGDKPLISGNQLSYTITDTNIQRLGMVKGLETQGDSLLSGTLYTNNSRIGINTTEPAYMIDAWDQEVEIAIGKQQKDRGWINMPRNQELMISVGKNENLVLGIDGSVRVQQLSVGGVEISSEEAAPTHVAPPGSMAINSRPVPGGAAGWISLGGGTWSRFGTLT